MDKRLDSLIGSAASITKTRKARQTGDEPGLKNQSRLIAWFLPLVVCLACQRAPNIEPDLVARAERARVLNTGPIDLDAIQTAISDQDVLVRDACVQSLSLRPPAEVAALLARPTFDAAPWRPALIVGQLADHLSDPAARDAARSYCSDPSSIREPLLRSRAIQPCLESELLSVDALRTLSEDAHWAVRARLARALTSRAGAHLKSSSAAGLLQRLSEDEHPTVRRAARGDADPV